MFSGCDRWGTCRLGKGGYCSVEFKPEMVRRARKGEDPELWPAILRARAMDRKGQLTLCRLKELGLTLEDTDVDYVPA